MNIEEQIVEHAHSLPKAPHLLPKLLKLLKDPNTDLETVAKFVAVDPELSASVLKLCNSAAIGGGTAVANIGEAVNRLGLQALYRLVATASASRLLRPGRPLPGLDAQALWEHSVTSALAAQLLARDHKEDESALFTLGLLHESGKVVMSSLLRDPYAQVLRRCTGDARGLALQESEVFGIHHARAAAALLQAWKFPDPYVEAMSHYFEPNAARGGARMAAAIFLSDTVARLVKENDLASSVEFDTEAGAALGMTAEDLPGYRRRVLEDLELVKALCRT